MLEINKSLKVLNLEANNLTNSEKDTKGIRKIAESLTKNTNLISLNLNSCDLNKNCSRMLADAMEENDTLILLDVEGNPKMDIFDVRKIQDKLE